ncbi:hypothetical protein BASA83_011949 [Batrachochytrium salamandrivorans]|nr:hypothetical protein BASA83_011949 [Batrachochytrium salamandrivorans]
MVAVSLFLILALVSSTVVAQPGTDHIANPLDDSEQKTIPKSPKVRPKLLPKPSSGLLTKSPNIPTESTNIPPKSPKPPKPPKPSELLTKPPKPSELLTETSGLPPKSPKLRPKIPSKPSNIPPKSPKFPPKIFPKSSKTFIETSELLTETSGLPPKSPKLRPKIPSKPSNIPKSPKFPPKIFPKSSKTFIETPKPLTETSGLLPEHPKLPPELPSKPSEPLTETSELPPEIFIDPPEIFISPPEPPTESTESTEFTESIVSTEPVHERTPLSKWALRLSSNRDPVEIELNIGNLHAAAHVKGKQVFFYSFTIMDNWRVEKIAPSTPESTAKMSSEEAISVAVNRLKIPFYSDVAPVTEYYSTGERYLPVLVFQLRDELITKWFEVRVSLHTGDIALSKDFKRGFTYDAIELPNKSPDDGFNTIVNPENIQSSPNGWTEGYRLIGNNVEVKSNEGRTFGNSYSRRVQCEF